VASAVVLRLSGWMCVAAQGVGLGGPDPVAVAADMVHLSGHGLPAGLILEDDTGRHDLITSTDLIDLVADQIKLVTLTACESAAVTAAEHLLDLRPTHPRRPCPHRAIAGGGGGDGAPPGLRGAGDAVPGGRRFRDRIGRLVLQPAAGQRPARGPSVGAEPAQGRARPADQLGTGVVGSHPGAVRRPRH
jgi:CHAT domain